MPQSVAARHVMKHPLAFGLRVLRGFGCNQGLMMAGAIANYALLSVLPLLILLVIGLSHWVDQAALLLALGRYLEWLVPSQSQALLADVSGFLDNRVAIGVLLLLSMLFFSSQAFSVLEKAMAVIFAQRKGCAPRPFLVSALLPYCFVLLLGLALLLVTLASAAVQSFGVTGLQYFGQAAVWSGAAGGLFYVLGFVVEMLILAAFYLILPAGRIAWRHALIGGLVAALLWEVLRHGLIWYFATLSQASVVYGSLTTAVVALLSMEIAATVLLLGAQVIAEYEQVEDAESASVT